MLPPGQFICRKTGQIYLLSEVIKIYVVKSGHFMYNNLILATKKGEIMGKDKNVKKDTKKKPSKTLKEKQAAKRLKKTGKAGE